MSEAPDGIRSRLIDRFGRVHNSLRISVTDRCNIRCFYCMPADNVVYTKRSELLTFEEIERFVRVVARMGVDKVRLTGGEPLVRCGLPDLVGRLTAVPGIRDVSLTTNGLLLREQAAALHRAGLRRINIHLDTLDRARFRQITGRDGLERVLDGIAACARIGFNPIKINAVAIRGSTEADIVPWGHFARRHPVQVRFIEYMPLNADSQWERQKVLLADEIVERLTDGVMPLVPVDGADPQAPATEFVFRDGCGRIGIIASVSRPFCGSCSRIRITADGKVRNCLFALDEFDVRAVMRAGGSDDQVAQVVRRAVGQKWEGHEINTSQFVQPQRAMHAIGG